MKWAKQRHRLWVADLRYILGSSFGCWRQSLKKSTQPRNQTKKGDSTVRQYRRESASATGAALLGRFIHHSRKTIKGCSFYPAPLNVWILLDIYVSKLSVGGAAVAVFIGFTRDGTYEATPIFWQRQNVLRLLVHRLWRNSRKGIVFGLYRL